MFILFIDACRLIACCKTQRAPQRLHIYGCRATLECRPAFFVCLNNCCVQVDENNTAAYSTCVIFERLSAVFKLNTTDIRNREYIQQSGAMMVA